MTSEIDATSLRPGSIVRIDDPRSSTGSKTYAHYFIVLFVPQPLAVGASIFLVGISSRVPARSRQATVHVPIRWMNRPHGHPETGMSKPCWACANFTHELEVKAGTFPLEVVAEFRGRFVDAATLQAIIHALNAS